MTQLIGRRIIWEDKHPRDHSDPGGYRSVSLLLDPGRYILNALIAPSAGSEHSIDVEVTSDNGKALIARPRISTADIGNAHGRIGVFEVAPPSQDVVLRLVLHGLEGVVFRGIEVVAEDWPFEKAEFVIQLGPQLN